jgi:transcriptional regulator with XRE-family HTH domain
MAVAGRSSRSAEELAKHSGVSLTTIEEIEHATELRNRRKGTLPNLSIALGAGISKMVDR